ncbi:hypothetical protein [Lacticaseibacillus daqingensis]|uniref:hypothetical protein n=1 Tax=Lacticaseibacillus daqingensis TaxID=2486014 RepID=UPI000F76F08D|nr:hypothetical protein [Lacticaseibacillus daqingensis]
MPNRHQPLPLYDGQGQPLKLKLKVTYKLRVKNGYILGLQPDQRQTRLPNLLAAHHPLQP